MHAVEFYDYAAIRLVPRVERGEFINVGILLSCAARGHLDVRIELDEARALALDPALDLALVRRLLGAIEAVCRGGADAGAIGLLPPRARFHWLTAQRSAILQTSPVHGGKCADLDATMEHLLQRMVRIAGRG
ncbi:DUF3037 domain-containing protein [Luteimonas viscosa]|uniref:DUF3037 domain-containing protein n=1 Tax=Luteimonas viscosa TaxID=1132694 RepID=A0A5D4XN90_9GAMM|nr:DUF3037 domain-containing protein [Luteimonas viscosa]TYT26138.1 DUF3037 domain-containing protein [Luteimonas viscosa]